MRNQQECNIMTIIQKHRDRGDSFVEEIRELFADEDRDNIQKLESKRDILKLKIEIAELEK
ncbi:MAG: hypothetical protein K0Q53_116 [Massilibacillus sp.]|jgi:hypothetical protein|nr:hypothetical protein [Massilibacillus sp.]